MIYSQIYDRIISDDKSTMKLRRHILNIRMGGASMSGNDVVRFMEVANLQLPEWQRVDASI